MSQKTRDNLDELRERTGAVSVAEVIREALAVYDLASSQVHQPSTVAPAPSATELVRQALAIYGFVRAQIDSGNALVVRSREGSEERVHLL